MHVPPHLFLCILIDMKESNKDTLRPVLQPDGNAEPSLLTDVLNKPAVELNNFVAGNFPGQSASSLYSGSSSSSVGSVRGEEGGAYAEFYGDYSPLFDNSQDAESLSLHGKWRKPSYFFLLYTIYTKTWSCYGHAL